MIKAIWKDTVLAESTDTVIVDRRHYFKIEDVNLEYLVNSNKHTVCEWKGEASYYTIIVNGKKNIDAAWYYPEPSEKAMNMKGRIAFSYIHGIDIIED